jgi:hypothetical protein
MREGFDDMLPQEIKSLVGRCEIGVVRFDNDDMSTALKFGEMLWSYFVKLADYYERREVKAESMGHSMVAKAMGEVARDVRTCLAQAKVNL